MKYYREKHDWDYGLIIAIVMLVVGIVLFFPVRYSQPYTGWEQTYEGREIFYTEEEYSQFKQAIVDYEVPLRNIEVLSSKPPTIVEFRYITITGLLDENEEVIAIKEFPYGQAIREEPIKTRSKGGVNCWGFIIGLPLIIIFWTPLIALDGKEES